MAIQEPPLQKASYTIQEVSKLTGVSIHTLRYYEKVGLLNINRADNGHRRYHDEDIAWVRFLVRLKATGMSLEMIHQYITLYREDPDNVSERLSLLETHYQNVQDHLSEIQQHLSFIHVKINHYRHLQANNLSDSACIYPNSKTPPNCVNLDSSN